MFGPLLTGEKIRLVPITADLLPDYVRWLADLDVTCYMGISSSPTIEMERDWYEKTSKDPNELVWAVFAGEKHIGSTGLHHINWRSRNAISGNLIGAKEEWGKGYGSEAVALRTRYGFEMLGLEKLKTEVLAENLPSRRVLEKAGYKTVGIARRELFRHGRWHDLWLGEVLKDDWLAAQNQHDPK
jgi:[ribosomal protein S5]-alanine N-acetyltransferase